MSETISSPQALIAKALAEFRARPSERGTYRALACYAAGPVNQLITAIEAALSVERSPQQERNRPELDESRWQAIEEALRTPELKTDVARLSAIGALVKSRYPLSPEDIAHAHDLIRSGVIAAATGPTSACQHSAPACDDCRERFDFRVRRAKKAIAATSNLPSSSLSVDPLRGELEQPTEAPWCGWCGGTCLKPESHS